MKVGLFGFACDPPTAGHMMIANHMAELVGLDKVTIVPSSSKRDDKTMKTSDDHRWEMLMCAVEGNCGDNGLFYTSDYEMTKPANEVFTYFTMEHFKNIYPEDEWYFMMGADNLIDLAKGTWTYGKELVGNNRFIVISRNGVDLHQVLWDSEFLQPYRDRFQLLQMAEDINISSTRVRYEFSQGRNPRYMVTDPVFKYIKENGLYV